jgi:hypothetical protein
MQNDSYSCLSLIPSKNGNVQTNRYANEKDEDVLNLRENECTLTALVR